MADVPQKNPRTPKPSHRTKWVKGARKENQQTVSGSMRVRANLVIQTIFFLFAIVLIVNLFRLMVIDHDTYADMANSRQFDTITIPAARGSIYDANGNVLAQSATVYRIFVDPNQLKDDLESVEKRNAALLQEAAEQKADGVNAVPDLVNTEQLKDQLAAYLAEKLEVEKSEVLEQFNANTRYEVIKRRVEKTVADEIIEAISNFKPTGSQRTISFSCISRQSDTRRYYPQNELAAAVIGFNKSDGEGLIGLELQYDEYLSGIDGKTITATDANGNEMPYRYSKTYPAQDGDDLYITIDMTLQTYLENAINDMVESFQVGNRACGIILNAKTGAVMAMATVSGFDPNDPYTIYDPDVLAEIELITDETEQSKAIEAARQTQWRNKCITETYIPGSVFKVFTASAGLEEDVISYDSTFNCTGSILVADTLMHCWRRVGGHGTQTFEQVLTNSCNPAFISIGQALGKSRFYQYFEAFGLNEKTGIDLPGETASVYQRLETMGEVELASCSFGQTNSISPLEMVTGYAAVVNGGYLLKPYVVSKIVDSDGNIVMTQEKTVRRQVISSETSAEMRQALQAVVENNGGGNAYIKGYKIGGKSGTAQIISGDISADDQQYVASYCCFAPADDPEIVMLIMADRPDTSINYYGSSVVVPYARAVLEKALPYLGFYPEYTEEEQAKLDVTVPLLIDRSLDDVQTTLTDLGLTYEVVGDGTTVNMQTPITGSAVSKGSKVMLYTGTEAKQYVTVPNVVGLSLEQANAAFAEAGLNWLAKGASTDRKDVKVLLQSVEPGTVVERYSVVTLDFGTSAESD